eukprot:g1413.t1
MKVFLVALKILEWILSYEFNDLEAEAVMGFNIKENKNGKISIVFENFTGELTLTEGKIDKEDEKVTPLKDSKVNERQSRKGSDPTKRNKAKSTIRKGKKASSSKKRKSPDPDLRGTKSRKSLSAKSPSQATGMSMNILEELVLDNAKELFLEADLLHCLNSAVSLFTPLSLQSNNNSWRFVNLVQQQAPSRRWASTATAISPSKVLIFGGENDDGVTLGDAHLFDVNASVHGENAWSTPMNCEQPPRCWHTSSFVKEANSVIVFGGQRVNTANAKPETVNDLMVLDTELMLWYPPMTHGRQPSARSGHSATLIDVKVNEDGTNNESQQLLILFGGNKGRLWLNDIFALDVGRWFWSNPKISGRPPSPRVFHSSTLVGNRVIFFGGNDGVQGFNDIIVLEGKEEGEGENYGNGGTGNDNEKEQQENVSPSTTINKRRNIALDGWRWWRPILSGEGPSSRAGHSALALSDHELLIFGGWNPLDDTDGQLMPFTDAFVLNTNNWTWSQAIYPHAVGWESTCKRGEGKGKVLRDDPESHDNERLLHPTRIGRVGQSCTAIISTKDKNTGKARRGVLSFFGQDRTAKRHNDVLFMSCE